MGDNGKPSEGTGLACSQMTEELSRGKEAGSGLEMAEPLCFSRAHLAGLGPEPDSTERRRL